MMICQRCGIGWMKTDAVMNDIKKVRTINDWDDKQFVELINVVESGFCHLQILSLQSEI